MTKLQTHRLFTLVPSRSRDGGSLEKLSLQAMICIVVLFCAAAVIVSPAQSVFFTTVASFDGGNGASPEAALIQANDGSFYGTTYAGGVYIGGCNDAGCGTIFKMTPSGAVTTLYTGGDGFDGTNPKAALVQATDGNFYGTTVGGGADDEGTIFKLTPSG